MTKINFNALPECTSEQLYDTLITHRYYNVGLKCLEKRGIKDPNILHLILEYYEISKIDNKINKGK